MNECKRCKTTDRIMTYDSNICCACYNDILRYIQKIRGCNDETDYNIVDYIVRELSDD